MINKRISIILFTLLMCGCSVAKGSEVVDVRCQHQVAPLGIQVDAPLFSWKLESKERDIRQTSYRILVADNLQSLQSNKGNLWDSGICSSEQSLNVAYQGRALQPTAIYYWKVKVWDNKGKESKWTSPAKFQMGLFTDTDWQPAQWIGMEVVSKEDEVYPGYQLSGSKVAYLTKEPAMPQFRKSFVAHKKIISATAFISGLGHFELSINGNKVGDHFLDPGWSKYDKASLYVTFDVTDQVKKGENVIGVRLGNGFLHIPRDSTRYRKLITTFAYPKMICKVRITYADGSYQNVNSNNTWRVCPSPITFSSIYGGEDYDATRQQKGWDTPGFDDSQWQQPLELPAVGRLSSQTSPPLKVKKALKPVEITQASPGMYVYDFGQNASAIVALTIKGSAGSKVVMRPAEYLTKEGLANQNNSGNPYWFSYTLRGDKTESWQPSFSYYGFRYVQVEGAVPAGYDNPSNLPVIEGLELLHVNNSSPVAGQFHCSNALFNNIYSLIDWSVRSNMASVLTDCPHREKLGWLEVTHLMSSSIAYAYDIKQMYSKIIEDMKDSQLENGLVPNTAPEFANFGNDFRDSPEWGSASVILPWFLYEWYGDKTALANSYDLMQSYTAYLTSRTKEYILYHGLGDWYDLGPNHPGYSQLTARGLTPTALYYYDLKIMERTSSLLGKAEETMYYRTQADKVRQAFNNTFFDKGKGYYDRGSQTANAIPLYMGLAKEEDRPAILKQLIADIQGRGNSITSGDIGFRYLLRVLEQEDASGIIFDMNSQSDTPGYGYQLKQGATSLTESWQALQTASHNHCMLGHLMEWFYSGIGGIRSDKESIAFKHFIIRPEIVGDIDAATVSFDSPYGMIKTNWKVENSTFTCQVTVPPNTTASIHLPAAQQEDIKESGKALQPSAGICFEKIEKGRSVYLIPSGDYLFTVSNFNTLNNK